MRLNQKKIINNIEEVVTLSFFFLMCLFILLQLISRFILNNPMIFTEEIARYSYVWITFIGMSLATKQGDHIKVDFFINLLPKRWMPFMEKAINIFSLVIILYLGYIGIKFMSFSRMNVSAALHIPLYIIYASFPIGCFLTALRIFQSIFAPKEGV